MLARTASSLLAQASTSAPLAQDFARAATGVLLRGYHKNVSTMLEGALALGPGVLGAVENLPGLIEHCVDALGAAQSHAESQPQGCRRCRPPAACALPWRLALLQTPHPAPLSTQVVDHYEKPRNVGSFDKSDPNVGTGLVGAPACGDVMKLQIKVGLLLSSWNCSPL